MPYRFKTSEPYCEFKVRDRGPGGHEALSIEIEFTLFDNGTEHIPGVAFKTALKNLPRGSWHYAGDGRWFILPKFLEEMKRHALAHFHHVYLTEGEQTTDLRSGQTTEQKGLFG